jgi:hypothetical protein
MADLDIDADDNIEQENDKPSRENLINHQELQSKHFLVYLIVIQQQK